MNENLNLVEILKDCPKGTKLYSPIYGGVELEELFQDKDKLYPIRVKLRDNALDDFTKDGRINADYDGECTLFPSKDQRDWSKFKPKKPKFDPKTLRAFDKVLVRLSNESYNIWYADFVSQPALHENEAPMTISSNDADMVIPYNDDTKHLVGTTDEAPEYYRYWEE